MGATAKPLPVAKHPDARTDLPGWMAYAQKMLDGRPVIISVSGGKDSLAVALLFKEAGIPFQCCHMDTGWEHPITEDYVRSYLPTVIGPIKILQGRDGGMENLIRRKRMFPSRVRRFCTQELKVYPFRDYLLGLDDEPVNAIGIRGDESQARSRMTEWEFNKTLDCDVWRPIFAWSYQDVIDIHTRHGVKPNPLYTELGQTRVGCWPCIHARKVEIRAVADLDPGRIDRLERLEQEILAMEEARYAEKGESFESKGIERPSFFQDPRARTNKRLGVKAKGYAPIREVVEWARTKRGGKAFTEAPDYGREGCMRWGMCDVPSAPPSRDLMLDVALEGFI